MIIVTFLTCSCKRDFVFSLQNYKYYSKCMYRHIVLFKIQEDILPETKEEVMNTFRQDILALKAVIPCLKDVMVSFNINTAEQWDICLDSTFGHFEDIAVYSGHPAHVAAAGKLKPYLSGRACTDFEI